MNAPKGKTCLFLCGCSTNVSSNVDLDAIAEWAKKRGDIEIVEYHNLLCSPDGKKFFMDVLLKNNPDYVVVAGCSPKMHEKTFQELAEEAGLNMAFVQMANIREQCAWVTKDKKEATVKSKALISAAIHRVQFADKLERHTMEAIPDILIIGGGIAGIEAALMAAQADRKVYLVEKDISIGGSVIQTEEVAPNMECAPCLLAPRLSEIRDNHNITIYSYSEVTDILGFYGNFVAKIHKKARYVDDSCIGCNACFDVCPVTLPNEFHLGLGTRNAIYTLFPGAVPAMAVIDKEHCKHFIDDSCDACVAACPFGSINFNDRDEDIEVKVGAVVLATGFASFNPSNIDGLGYGKIADVYTLPEFERLASSNGPTSGQIKLRNGEKPKSVAIIHCAGSLRDDGLPYCSLTCCIGAAKVGELVRKQIPDATVYNVHNDLVFPGPAGNKFYKRQRNGGTQFIKCDDLKSVKITSNGKGISVEGKGFGKLNVDMVVLATGQMPSESTKALAEMLNIDLTESGYFKADHEILHATGASVDGIYVAGTAAGPCDIATSITSAHAAVGHAVSKLVPGRKIELEIMTSYIDEEICGGCKLCISVCPYKAISFDIEKNISVVTEALCRGCGTCVASCPSGAATAKHFTDKQVFAEIGGLLHG